MGPPHYDDLPIPTWEEFCLDFEDYYFNGSKPKFGRVFIIKYGGEEIGAICYASFHLHSNRTELDIWMGSDRNCGKGLGTEAIMLLSNDLKNNGIDKFIIRPSKRNTRAVRAFEKAGFVKVNDRDKQTVILQYIKEEFLEAYGAGDYGKADDVVLIME